MRIRLLTEGVEQLIGYSCILPAVSISDEHKPTFDGKTI
jgi:hypothetical protein